MSKGIKGGGMYLPMMYQWTSRWKRCVSFKYKGASGKTSLATLALQFTSFTYVTS